jgi:type II secretory pathway component PulC
MPADNPDRGDMKDWQPLHLGPNRLATTLLLLATVLVTLVVERISATQLRTQASRAAPAVAATADRQPQHAADNLDALPGWHMFGRAAGELPPPAEPVSQPMLNADELPDTSLTLTLVGVFFADDRPYAWVIIEAPGVGQRRYTVGDTLPGGAVIDAIQRKAVVLDQNGKKEALRLRTQPTAGTARDARSANLPLEPQVPEK